MNVNATASGLDASNFFKELRRKLTFSNGVVDRRGYEYSTRLTSRKRNEFSLSRTSKTPLGKGKDYVEIEGLYDDKSVLIFRVQGHPQVVSELFPLAIRYLGADVPLGNVLDAIY